MNYYPYAVDLWENDVIAPDEFDSDQLDEDESYSWGSNITDAQEGCTANWRGWRPTINNNSNNNNNNNDSKLSLIHKSASRILNDTKSSNNVEKLVDICAKYIALNIPFELVETYPQPIPEDLQLKITFSSFPDNVDDIRLYSCLANGNSDEYNKGEQLYYGKNVKNILQIGFHLSATVVYSSNPGPHKMQTPVNVSVVCDRKKITSCHCSCSKPSSWCSHIVAVCLCRINEPHTVELRAPVSESLSKLQRDQLQKFAQYLISELPQQILPTAQKLLDELLKSNSTSINVLSGAPDPTAGPSAHEISVWCLDEQLLQENIHKTLSKFIVPSPHVVSDIDYLAHASSAASAEYASLLRPLRGREPEGMWNLISIIKEMFRKSDKNSIPLLKIITQECVCLDQVQHLWFLIKVSPLYNERTYNHNTYNHRQHNHTPPVHQACAALLDEIVSLWRILVLNPLLKNDEKHVFKEQLQNWQKQTYDKLRKFCNSAPDKMHLLRRLDLDFFSAFLPAIESCEMSWCGFDFSSIASFKRICYNCLPIICATNKTVTTSKNVSVVATTTNPTSSVAAATAAVGVVEPNVDVDNNENRPLNRRRSSNNGSSSSEGFCEDNFVQNTITKKLQQSISTELTDIQKRDETIDELLTDTVFVDTLNKTTIENIQPSKSFDFDNNLDTLETLFARCEALYSHGFIEHSSILAKILAEYLLSSHNVDKIYEDCINSSCLNDSNPSSNNNNQTTNTTNINNNNRVYINNFQSSVLWRSALICNVLLESQTNNQLAFTIGIFGLETQRMPAASKALEVKLFNQEQDLVTLLKRIPITHYELNILRDRAQKIKNCQFNCCKCCAGGILPIMLASFTFDMLTSSENHKYRQLNDDILGFEAAVSALGYKPNVSEAQHSIFCEGVRRQKGELAITLLLAYKDDQTKLLKILDKILDKSIHVLFKTPINPFQPNLKKIQQNNLQKTSSSSSVPQQTGAVAASNCNIASPSTSTLNSIESQTILNKNNVTTAAANTKSPNTTNPQMTASNSTSNQLISTGNKNFAIQIIKPDQSTIQNTQNNTNATTNQPQQQQQPSKLNTIKYSAIDSLSSGWEESESETPNTRTLLETKFRCLNLKQNTTKPKSSTFSTFDSSAPETTSSDNSPTINRKTNWPVSSPTTTITAASNTATPTSSINQSHTNTNSDVVMPKPVPTLSKESSKDQAIESDDSGESLNSTGGGGGGGGGGCEDKTNTVTTSSVATLAVENAITTKPWADGSFCETATTTITEKSVSNNQFTTNVNSYDPSKSNDKNTNSQFSNDLLNTITNAFIKTTNQTTTSTTTTNTNTNNNNNNNNMNTTNLINNAAIAISKQFMQQQNSRSNRAKNRSPTLPNQPSEALAHFMFEFSKTVLSKAGGTVSTSVFLNQNNNGPHRNLHICAFLIALYALGLHNCVQANWLSRTYSSYVSWINGQAIEIGYPAICILIECWEGHFTPIECALLADRASRVRDTITVKAAAELALSSLKYSHSLNLQEIQRALTQCKEQSSDMLQQACLVVESSLKEGNNIYLTDILFEVGRRWDELYVESLRESEQLQRQHHHNHHQQQIQQRSAQPHVGSTVFDELICPKDPNDPTTSTNTFQNQNLFNLMQHPQQRATAVAATAAVAAAAVAAQQKFTTNNQQQQQQQQSTPNDNTQNYMQLTTPLQQLPLPNQPQMPPQMNIDPNLSQMVHTQFPYMQHSQGQPAPFAFAVQTLPYPQYVPLPGSVQNTGPIHMTQNMFIPAMYTAYGTIVTAAPPTNSTSSQQLYNPQVSNTNTHNSYAIGPPQLGLYQASNVSTGYIFQNQIASIVPTNSMTNISGQHQQSPSQSSQQPQPVTQQQQQLQQQQIQTPKHLEMDSTAMKYLSSAFRVGMLALEALPRRVDSQHQIKYLRSPPYADNVKWLWNVSIKLSTNNLQQFCQVAANVIQNPFLIHELAYDSANYLCHNNPAHLTHAIRSPMLNLLVQRCLNMYFRCCMQRMHHLTPNDHEDFINMVVTARNAFYLFGNIQSFTELLQNFKRSKQFKKDLWTKLANALSNTSTSNY